VGLERAPDGVGCGRGWITLPGGSLTEATSPAALDALLRRRRLGNAEGFWRSPLGYAVALLPAMAPLERLDGLAEELPGDLRGGLVLMQAWTAGSVGAEPARVEGELADYRLRFFAPGLGIPEDPVTGSAHALVAPWWMERLGRRRVVGWQCSDRPGGMVCEAASSSTIRLSGSGHLLWDGTLFARPRICAADSSEASSWRHLACAG
jgi:hypothetical protein